MQRDMQEVVRTAKADAWSKARGGFAVYRLSNGALDYFHVGEVPNIAGQRDTGATFLARWHWDHERWIEERVRD